MYRAIITPTEGEHTLELPKEFFGKKVEVTVVEMERSNSTVPPVGKKVLLSQVLEDFGTSPDFPSVEEIRSKAWPSKW